NTGVPQGCVLSPILYTLYTHNCVTSNRDNTILKFADDTAVIGHITGGTQWLIGKRWPVWCHGVRTTTSPSTLIRQKR
ncbi:reverse transcriptase domain-containing protein, partial [Streptococcus pyogenes]